MRRGNVMGMNYFTSENAWRHLFFITGLTSDEFYEDSGLKVNIEQLTYLELKKSGYERIVFYDKDHKLYCYDDESYRLLRVNGSRRSQEDGGDVREASSLIRKNRGLKRGKHAHNIARAKEDKTGESKKQQEAFQSKEEDSRWTAGAESGILMQGSGQGPLHLGMVNTTFVKRQIDAYMYDSFIKTAVVINDPTSFLREFGDDPLHSVTAGYERMGTNNENILVFLYTDEELGNIYQVSQMEDEQKDVNRIRITCPNAAELRNLLMYCRVNHGLKIRISRLKELALALRHAMALSPRTVRIKELYIRLRKYGTDQMLDVDGCYRLLGVKKPDSAKEQLSRLIGMQQVKEVLSEYDTGENQALSVFDYQTASRLQPDLEGPKKQKQMIHFALTGNPGTGKTTVAKLVGQLFREMGYLETGHVVEADRSMLVGSHVGETAILTRQQVEAAMGGVLFIDEAYSLKRQQDTGNDFGQEAIDTLCKLMDQYKGEFIVVAAGYPKEMEIFLKSNPGLSSRMKTVEIEDYSPEEMCRILRFHAHRQQARFSRELEAGLSNFCENWVNLADDDWGNAREAVNLTDAMIRAWKKDPARVCIREHAREYAVLDTRHIPENCREYLKPAAQMREEVLQRLNQMTGLKEVKSTVERIRKRMISGDKKEPGAYLFMGNPGTGKTTVARYMGQILRNLGMLKKGQMVEYTASKLMAEVFNDTNRGDFSQVAKKALDGVLFIDEAYQLVSDTTGRGRAILDAMLPFMENNRRNLCVIAAGYEDEMKDLVESNPGYESRFTQSVYFENYTGGELCEILLKSLEERGITADEEYKENALRALTRYVEIHGKEREFGNARYVRNVFLPQSLDAQNDRLIGAYGEDFPRELKKRLTGEDIPADLVRFTRTPLEKPDTRSAMEKLDSLIGYKKIKEELRRLLNSKHFHQTNELGILGMPERLHWVLEGNPGTGKTTIVNLIGQVYQECGILPSAKVYKVTRSDLVAGYEGQTAIKTRRCIEKAMGGILFIDEAYSLTKSEVEGGGFGQEAITELVEAMESMNGEFAVVCAGYPDDMEDFLRANSGLGSRMKKFILEDYTPGELVQIFAMKCKKEKTVIEEELMAKLEVFFSNKKRIEGRQRDWGNGREAENLLREMLHEWMEHQVFCEEQDGQRRRLLTQDHIPEEQKRFLKGKISGETKKATVFDEIQNLIGFQAVKEKLNDLMILKNTAVKCGREELLEDLNYHWVLRGNPGTGKTTVAELIGKVYKELGLLPHGRTVKVTRADLVAGYVGQTAIKTKKCIERAMGGVLFIDEAYTLKRSDSGEDSYGQEAIDTLLEQMSARNGEFAVVVAGYPREMETFLDSNPGFASRFDDDFLLKDYTAEELLQIFEGKCKKKGFCLEEETRVQIRQLFANMISAKSKNWANGREAENLEKRMRSMWAKNPVNRTEGADGEVRSYYTTEHIPDRYRIFLSKSPAQENHTVERKEESKEKKQDFFLPADQLAPLQKEFQYEENYLEQVKGVVFIRGKSDQGIASGSGGILTSDGHILTCHHVVSGHRDIEVRVTSEKDKKMEQRWEKAKVVWEDASLDAAVLKIEGGNYPALPLRGRDTDTFTGESIYHWGYPFGDRLSDDPDKLQPSLFQGYISSIQTKNGLERINTNMEAKRGCSGGPVFSKKDGSIIGILCGSQTMGDQGLIEEINYVLPVKHLWKNLLIG